MEESGDKCKVQKVNHRKPNTFHALLDYTEADPMVYHCATKIPLLIFHKFFLRFHTIFITTSSEFLFNLGPIGNEIVQRLKYQNHT